MYKKKHKRIKGYRANALKAIRIEIILFYGRGGNKALIERILGIKDVNDQYRLLKIHYPYLFTGTMNGKLFSLYLRKNPNLQSGKNKWGKNLMTR